MSDGNRNLTAHCQPNRAAAYPALRVITLVFCGVISLIMSIGCSDYSRSSAVDHSTPSSAPASEVTSKEEDVAFPFDATTENVGTNFKGHDVAELVALVQKEIGSGIAPKDEFETSKEFQARQQEFRSRVRRKMPDGHLAFTISEYLDLHLPSNWGASTIDSSFTYDADKELFKVSVFWRPEGAFLDKSSGLVAVGNSTSQFSWTLRMPREQAKSFRSSGRALIICKLAEPWVKEVHIEHFGEGLPGGNVPYSSYNFLSVKPEQLWVIDSKTGAVLQKKDVRSVRND